MTSARAALATRALTKQYSQVIAVRDLDLVVPPLSICGFLGPNGAGKTTTIKMLLGLVRPTSGEASVLGFDCVRESTAVRVRVGYLAQDQRFPGHMTPRMLLRFVTSLFPMVSGPNDRVDATLDRLGLLRVANTQSRKLSGGQRQRLGIAQAMVHEPELLILDEPTASLDPAGRRDVLDAIAGLRQETTVVFSTHILDDVQRVCDRVAILHEGALLADGELAEILTRGGSNKLEDAFLNLVSQGREDPAW